MRNMQRFWGLMLAILLMAGCVLSAAEESPWVCPSCGKADNRGNFCPDCGAARPSGEWTCAACGTAGNSGNFCTNCGAARPGESAATVYESRPEVTGVGLLMKLATRSGPGTQYDEPGTFFSSVWKKTTVRVLGKSYDGSVWWVLVDFDNGGKASYRVWTGLKRVNVDINQLREIYPSGQGTVNSTSNTYRGPGGKYAKAKVSINGWKDVVAYGRENGYVEVEFEQNGKLYRLWVPESETSIDWGNDFSGEG